MTLLTLTILALFCFLAGWAVQLYRQLQRSAVAQSEAQNAADAVTRAVQLFAHELHSLSLGLRGHVDRLGRETYPGVGGMAALVAQLDDLAGELGAAVAQGGQPRRIEREAVLLAPLLTEVVATTRAAIAPGRRNVRVAGDGAAPLSLWADRRALRLVLTRVLGEAVRSSAHDDWIDIGWSLTPESLVLTVADEGHGGLASGQGKLGPDSRGIGLRLALARLLVQAHGGRLEIEATERVGAIVSIHLPRDMILNADVLDQAEIEKLAVNL